MTTQIEVNRFTFHTSNIRTITIGEEVWFVGRDVAEALGYSNTSKAVTDHCDAYKSLKDIDCTFHALPENLDLKTNMIQEPDLYALVFGSKLPSAKEFKKWVFEEVLPAIRKTGKYEIKKVFNPLETALEQSKQLVLLIEKQIEIENELLTLKNKEIIQDNKILNMESKIKEFDSETGYRTVLAYARDKNYVVPTKIANQIGRNATKLCKEKNLMIGKVSDERYGYVNSYPISVLDELFDK